MSWTDQDWTVTATHHRVSASKVEAEQSNRWDRVEANVSTARDVMTPGVQCVGENESVLDASVKLAELNVGAMPICGEDDRLKGMLSDRDIVVKVLAARKQPAQTRVGELAQGEPVTIGADDSVEEAVQTMIDHKVRRLPVIDGHKLVGMLSQADLARSLPSDQVSKLVEAISAAP